MLSLRHTITLGYVEWDKDGAAGVEVGQYELPQLWEGQTQTDSHSSYREGCLRPRGDLLLSLFLMGGGREGGREGETEEGT